MSATLYYSFLVHGTEHGALFDVHYAALCDTMICVFRFGSLSLYTAFDIHGYILLMRVPIYKLIWLDRSIKSIVVFLLQPATLIKSCYSGLDFS